MNGRFLPAKAAKGDRTIFAFGEGEDISARIKNHDTAKDWWASAVLITTAGNNLNKAHVKYLEARLIEEARRVGKGTENYAFKSPSAAAAVVNGRPANGTIEWKLQATGQTYKEWEAESLKPIPESR